MRTDPKENGSVSFVAKMNKKTKFKACKALKPGFTGRIYAFYSKRNTESYL